MHKHIKLSLIAGLVILCLIILLSIFYPTDSRQQTHIMEAFMEKYYSAQSYDNYTAMMAGDFEVSDLLYQQQYTKLITKDEYDRMVANRVVLEAEKIVKQYGCTVSLRNSSFQKMMGSTVEGYSSYSYDIEVKLDFGDNDISYVMLTGTLVFTKQDDEWIISRFTPRQSFFKIVENR